MLQHIYLAQPHTKAKKIVPWEDPMFPYTEEEKLEQERQWAAKSGPVKCYRVDKEEIERMCGGWSSGKG
jgi:hypothetical protein